MSQGSYKNILLTLNSDWEISLEIRSPSKAICSYTVAREGRTLVFASGRQARTTRLR